MFQGFEKVIGRLPGGRTEFFETRDYPWTDVLEAGWQEIRRELDALLVDRIPNMQEFSPEQEMLTTDDRWKAFWFWAQGQKIGTNSDRCPETARLLGEIPGLRTAFFSILRGPKRLEPHRGPYKGVLRYHLGLRVPDVDACAITVGSQTRHWVEGGSLIFDDTFIHTAWNETSKDRAVLFVDFTHPCRFRSTG